MAARRRRLLAPFLPQRRHFSPLSPPSPHRHLRKLPHYLRPAAVGSAREAVTDYLHKTRGLPFHLSQLIASDSPSSLASFISSVRFSSKLVVADLAPSILQHLKYIPLPELDCLLESIGCTKSINSNPDL